MLFYRDGSQVHVGDQVHHDIVRAVVSDVIEGDEIARWGLEDPGFMLRSEEWGLLLINPGSFDWEDVGFVRRGD